MEAGTHWYFSLHAYTEWSSLKIILLTLVSIKLLVNGIETLLHEFQISFYYEPVQKFFTEHPAFEQPTFFVFLSIIVFLLEICAIAVDCFYGVILTTGIRFIGVLFSLLFSILSGFAIFWLNLFLGVLIGILDLLFIIELNDKDGDPDAFLLSTFYQQNATKSQDQQDTANSEKARTS